MRQSGLLGGRDAPSNFRRDLCCLSRSSARQNTLTQQDRFFDLPTDTSVETFDMQSVAMLGTHGFTIVKVTIDKPDVLRLRLAALGVLRGYCKRSAAEYPAPNDLLAMGRPDMPVHKIAVQLSEQTTNGVTQRWKTIWWDYPYSKLADKTAKGVEEDPDCIHVR